jgi:hypothetical protein
VPKEEKKLKVMTKILRFIASLGLATIAFNIGNYANALDRNSTLAHLDSESEFSHARSLTKLQINESQNVEFQTVKVGITDRNRSISDRGQWLQINFNPQMVPDPKLKDFNSVERNMLTESPVYFSCGGSVRKSTDFLGESCFPQAD